MEGPMKSKAYKNFEDLAGKVISVPHDDLKTKLDAEKAAKKRKKIRRSSASRVADA